jgi:hypothetical protein
LKKDFQKCITICDDVIIHHGNNKNLFLENLDFLIDVYPTSQKGIFKNL